MSEMKRTLVLDVLKLYEPSLPDFAVYLSEFKGVENVDIYLEEIDQRTESLKVTITGDLFPFEDLKEHLLKQGAVIQSVDQTIISKEE